MMIAVLFAASRIAVISVGTDAVPAGQLQRSVESRLVALPSVELMEAGAIAAEIGVKGDGAAPKPPDPEARRKLDGLLEAARQSFRNGDYDDALQQLALAEGLAEPADTDDRVRVLLQRIAVLVKMEDRDKATAAARSALELQPDLVVDLNVFPPVVNTLVSEVRATLPVRYTIELTDLPAVVRILVDGRPVGRRFAASPGRHRVSVAAPGFRTLEIALDVTKNATVDGSPPIALEKTLENSLFEQVWAADAASKDRPAARDLAARLGVDGIVIVASRSTPAAEARALVVWGKSTELPEIGPTKPTSQTGRAALTEWVATRVEAGPPKAAVVTNDVPRRPRSPAVWNVRGGMAVVTRHRDVKGTGGAGFGTDFTGAGPELTLDVRKRGFTAQLETGSQQYGSQRVNRPEGGSVTIQGGTGLRSRVGLGFAIGSDRIRVTPLMGVLFDQFGETDKRSEGKSLGVHPAQLWVQAYGRLEASSVVRERWSISGAYSHALPLANVSEEPVNTTGDYEGDDRAKGWSAEAGLAWLPIERMWVGGELSYEQRTVAFDGTADAPFTPPIVDARDTQTITSLQVFARYRF